MRGVGWHPAQGHAEAADEAPIVVFHRNRGPTRKEDMRFMVYIFFSPVLITVHLHIYLVVIDYIFQRISRGVVILAVFSVKVV